MNQALPPNVQARRVGPPKAVKWFFVFLFFLAGPGLLAFGGWELNRRSNELTQTATATVVGINIRQATDRKLHCAIVEWEHAGKTIKVELPECEGVLEARTVGSQLELRYSPDDPETPYPDTFMGTYGKMAIPVGIAGGLFTALFLFLIIPRRKKS